MDKPRRRLREPGYFVLASLMDGPLHGYAIIKQAADLSGSRVKLTAGTLYSALDRFSNDGWVEAVGDTVVDGRLRRSYRLTQAGLAVLAEEAQRLDEDAAVVASRLPGLAPRAIGA
jgi:PadR family transcriptional regulator, regulatory protein PadR